MREDIARIKVRERVTVEKFLGSAPKRGEDKQPVEVVVREGEEYEVSGPAAKRLLELRDHLRAKRGK